MNKLLKVFYDSIWKLPREIHIKELENGFLLNHSVYIKDEEDVAAYIVEKCKNPYAKLPTPTYSKN